MRPTLSTLCAVLLVATGPIAGDLRRWLERRELPVPSPALPAPPFDPF